MGVGQVFLDAWTYASDAGKAAAQTVARSTKAAYQYAEHKAAEAYHYAKQTTIVTIDRADLAIEQGKKGAIENRYERIRKELKQQKAGSPIEMCPLFRENKCKELNHAYNKALIAEDTYSERPYKKEVGELTRLDPNDEKDAVEIWKNLGLSPEDLEPVGSGFKAGVYKQVLNGKTEYVVGYRGTVPKIMSNLTEDVGQAVGLVDNEPDYSSNSEYKRAMRVARKASFATKKTGNDLSFTGHSLGGGMASAASATTGRKATTFNAAGLHANTVGGAYPDPPGPVDAYFTPTDPLNALQDNRTPFLAVLTNVAGAVHPVLGQAFGSWIQGDVLPANRSSRRLTANARSYRFPEIRSPRHSLQQASSRVMV